jgi:hypothetical protein
MMNLPSRAQRLVLLRRALLAFSVLASAAAAAVVCAASWTGYLAASRKSRQPCQ